jgi:hypothetical protein
MQSKLKVFDGFPIITQRGFKVVNEQEFEKYCRWNKKDDAGIVLAIINEQGEPVSSEG